MRQRQAASKQRTAAEYRLLFEKLTNTFIIFYRYRKRCYSNFVFTMKIQGLMVILLTAHVGAGFTKLPEQRITFPLKTLEPDLRAFSKYYKTFGQTYGDPFCGYLQWPNSIIFQVCLPHPTTGLDNKWFEINGYFDKTALKNPFLNFFTSYEAVYYKRETGQFFIPKDGFLEQISSDTLLRYVQSYEISQKPNSTYLSIRYFSLQELKEDIEHFYSKHMKYVKDVLKKKPATYLASPPNIGGHFVEYTYSSVNSDIPLADGGLRVLLGTVKKKHINIDSNTKAYSLFYDQNTHNCTIPGSVDPHSEPLQNVFGVRMETTGFMAEIRPRERKSLLLSDHDLTGNSDAKSSLQTFVRDLLKKVKVVDPRYSLFWPADDPPEQVKFQMLGQVCIKSVNFKNGRIDEDCPFTIEYAKKGRAFRYGNRLVEKLYTNDSAIWIEGEGPVPVPGKTVNLMH